MMMFRGLSEVYLVDCGAKLKWKLHERKEDE